MLCSTTRTLLRTNKILGPISASLLLPNQFLSHSKQTHLCFSKVSIEAQFLRPVLLFDLRSVRAMASQSQTTSVHDFTVKVGFSWVTIVWDTFLVSLDFVFEGFYVGEWCFVWLRNGFDSILALSDGKWVLFKKLGSICQISCVFGCWENGEKKEE